VGRFGLSHRQPGRRRGSRRSSVARNRSWARPRLGVECARSCRNYDLGRQSRWGIQKRAGHEVNGLTPERGDNRMERIASASKAPPVMSPNQCLTGRARSDPFPGRPAAPAQAHPGRMRVPQGSCDQCLDGKLPPNEDICTDGRERRIHPVTAAAPVATGRGVEVSYANDTHRSVSWNGCAHQASPCRGKLASDAVMYGIISGRNGLAQGATALDDQFGQKTLPL
jgi:hypothetical protein